MLPDEARAWFHHGATSQNVIDSALMHCLDLLSRCRSAELSLMAAHADTPMIGRMFMWQAMPITFGAKIAHWARDMVRAEQRLAETTRGGIFVQYGGPVGVRTGLAESGPDLMDALADELGLARALLPWHTDRQPVLALADALGAVAVAAEKIALDVALMAQTEIGEVSEPVATGAGGSSSMPYKCNPVGCARIRMAARQVHAQVALMHNAGAQPLERGLGEWHAEWAPLVYAVLYIEGGLETLLQLLAGLEVHADAMRRNLNATGGRCLAKPIIAFLAQYIDHERAATLVDSVHQAAQREQRDVADVLLEAPEIRDAVDARALREAVDPLAHVGASHAQVVRVQTTLQAMGSPIT